MREPLEPLGKIEEERKTESELVQDLYSEVFSKTETRPLDALSTFSSLVDRHRVREVLETLDLGSISDSKKQTLTSLQQAETLSERLKSSSEWLIKSCLKQLSNLSREGEAVTAAY